MTSVIEVQQVSKRYPNGTLALDDVSLEVQAGEVFGVLGPNGAGKTTLIKLMIGLLSPTQGKIRVMGQDMARAEMRVKAQSGVVHQINAFDDFLSVGDNLLIHGAFYGLSSREVRRRSDDLLEIFALGSKWKVPVGYLSGGERRKLQIVRALLNRPKVLFLDEPSTGLDVQARRAFHEMMRQQIVETGTTIIWTTHYLEEIESVCDRVAVLNRGRLIALESPAVLRKLVGGDIVEITLATTSERSQMLQQLQREGRLANALDETGIILRLGEAKQELMPLIKRWLQAGYEVQALSVKHATLEDAFLHLIGGGA